MATGGIAVATGEIAVAIRYVIDLIKKYIGVGGRVFKIVVGNVQISKYRGR